MRGHRTAFGARQVEQALLRLKPGGRLAAIVGRGMALERPTFRKWWAEIGQRYRVRANLGIDGSAYTKFGTTFDNQIIVIDRDGTTANEAWRVRVQDSVCATAFKKCPSRTFRGRPAQEQ